MDRLRAICLALPGATEKTAWQTPTFRAGGKMFAMYVNDHHGDGRCAVWCRAEPGAQDILVGAAPNTFFVPPYVAHQGWIGMRLDGKAVDWDEVAHFMAEAHRLAVPRRLAAQQSTAAAAVAAPTRSRTRAPAARQTKRRRRATSRSRRS